LQWIVSVQNLEIIQAMRSDEAPRLFAATYYSRHSLTADSGIGGIRLLDSSHADRDKFGMWHVRDLPGYTACSSYFDLYTYFSPNEMPSLPRLTHVLSRDDPGVKASRDRRNARFFVYEFLPSQLPRLPRYLWAVVRFRAEQAGRAWFGPLVPNRDHDFSPQPAPAT
jgi:hypothetical protein